MPRVFISYTHDSLEHRGRVLRLAQLLRRDGLDTVIDAFISGSPLEGWPLWMENQIEQADFVILVCSPTYFRRFSGKEREGVGLGGVWESNLTRDHLYAEQGRNRKFIPVYFEDGYENGSANDIPTLLRQRYTRYVLPREYESLLRYLTNQPLVIPEPIGPMRILLPDAVEAVVDGEGNAFSSCIREHMTLLNRHVEFLTHDQFRVIRQLRWLRRVRISGCAGSGKTLVAAEKAIRLAEAGISTLFLCHNPLLADHVRGLVAGSGVVVESFGKWVSMVAGEHDSSLRLWSHYEEPGATTLDHAFDAVVERGPRYDAVIVDEGQDFRAEWWAVVEAVLHDNSSGILYIFHDDLQALLPFRASYPTTDPQIDLSRNCRNAGRVYELLQKVNPDVPVPEENLRELGKILVVAYDRGDEVAAVGEGLRWIFAHGLGNSAVALHAGTGSLDDDLPSHAFAIKGALDWQLAVGDHFIWARDNGHWFTRSLGEIEGMLSELSTEPFPTVSDIEVVRKVAGLFDLGWQRRLRDDPRFQPLEWTVMEGRLVLTRSHRSTNRALELVLHFEREDWHHGIPQPETVQFRHHTAAGDSEIPLYRVADFKGLEADAVLLVLEGSGPEIEQQAYVGISRARILLAMLVERETVPALPYALRRSGYLRHVV
jgi:hypothetical protein